MGLQVLSSETGRCHWGCDLPEIARLLLLSCFFTAKSLTCTHVRLGRSQVSADQCVRLCGDFLAELQERFPNSENNRSGIGLTLGTTFSNASEQWQHLPGLSTGEIMGSRAGDAA